MKSVLIQSVLLSAASVALLVGCSQSTEQIGGKSSPNLSSMDNDYFKKIAVGNQTEIDSSQLALTQSQNEQVKMFAQKMITDHQFAASKVMTVANQKGVTTPQTLDDMHEKMVGALKSKTGPDFDKAYLDLQVMAHKETIMNDESEAKDGNDADVKSLAAELLPTLQMHLKMAEDLQHGQPMTGM